MTLGIRQHMSRRLWSAKATAGIITSTITQKFFREVRIIEFTVEFSIILAVRRTDEEKCFRYSKGFDTTVVAETWCMLGRSVVGLYRVLFCWTFPGFPPFRMFIWWTLFVQFATNQYIQRIQRTAKPE